MRKHLLWCMAVLLIVSTCCFAVGCDRVKEHLNKNDEVQSSSLPIEYDIMDEITFRGKFVNSYAVKNSNMSSSSAFAILDQSSVIGVSHIEASNTPTYTLLDTSATAPEIPVQFLANESGVPDYSTTVLPSEETVNRILNEYRALEYNFYFYTTEPSTSQLIRVKNDSYSTVIDGNALTNALRTNQLNISTNIVVKSIIAIPELVADWDLQNQEYLDSTSANRYFQNVYSFHKNQNDHFVLKTKSSIELDASSTGGSSCRFVRFCENEYNGRKISRFHSTVGVQMQTGGNQYSKDGTIFEIEFKWIQKAQ